MLYGFAGASSLPPLGGGGAGVTAAAPPLRHVARVTTALTHNYRSHGARLLLAPRVAVTDAAPILTCVVLPGAHVLRHRLSCSQARCSSAAFAPERF